MDFADRLAEVLYDAWDMKVAGSFAAAHGKDGHYTDSVYRSQGAYG